MEDYPHHDMTLPALFRAHHNAAYAGMSRAGVADLGAPRLLLVLREQESQGQLPSQRELADLLHVSAATITASLQSLERRGYVARQPDPRDSRRNLISLTQRGHDALHTCCTVFRQVDEAMFSGFSQEEIHLLIRFHQRMLQNLYDIGGNEDAPCPHAAP